MTELHLTYGVVGALGLALAMVSRPMRSLPLSEPLLALALGVVLGPYALGVVDPGAPVRDLVLLELSRLIVAVSVMGAALRFPAAKLGSVVRPVLVLLAVVMPLTAMISGAAALVLGLPLALAALVGASLCPTDPVLAGSIVSGRPAERDLPARLRHTLSVESGLNDGLALPLVGVALAVVLPATTPGAEAGRLTWEVLGGTGIGLVAGAVAALGVRAATRDDDLEPGPNLILTALLAVAVLGLGRAAGTDGILGVFVAGTVYNAMVTGDEREPQQGIDEAVNRYLCLPLFFLLGVVLPWEEWARFGAPAIAFVLIVLVGRRLPAVLALARPAALRRSEATFLGWFGPMGASSIFYVAHSVDEGVTDPAFFAAGTLAIATSVVAFGVTSSPGRQLYARSSAPAEDDDGSHADPAQREGPAPTGRH
ncbi:cation:proton antiporter [Georgenia sp. EYE_87]|uniref:cation:proton antiporter domain-containing protein n=1 Tax=Georgenia sp. EYE_87 TaxID=2853448 RepID=UPI0020032540|nr:cation:proton antiporter [Georgenia sp. EYE_87]MCK6210747.1 cation:proton antiporter [Georgenia sp. EYE_87]